MIKCIKALILLTENVITEIKLTCFNKVKKFSCSFKTILHILYE